MDVPRDKVSPWQVPCSAVKALPVSPQVMAIATLAACYNNQQVFRGVVKIRKGQAVTLMMDATNIKAVKAIMYQYVEEVGSAGGFESFLAVPVPVLGVELGIHGNLFIPSLAQWWWAAVTLMWFWPGPDCA